MCIETEGFIWTPVEEFASKSPKNWKKMFGEDIPYMKFELVYKHK
jgi:hypothetical protein